MHALTFHATFQCRRGAINHWVHMFQTKLVMLDTLYRVKMREHLLYIATLDAMMPQMGPANFTKTRAEAKVGSRQSMATRWPPATEPLSGFRRASSSSSAVAICGQRTP